MQDCFNIIAPFFTLQMIQMKCLHSSVDKNKIMGLAAERIIYVTLVLQIP